VAGARGRWGGDGEDEVRARDRVGRWCLQEHTKGGGKQDKREKFFLHKVKCSYPVSRVCKSLNELARNTFQTTLDLI
jgi:hypothetical protein